MAGSTRTHCADEAVRSPSSLFDAPSADISIALPMRHRRSCDALEFDINDLATEPALRDAELARLRREDPVHWDERNGFWLITRYADVRELSKQPELFSSEPKGPWHLLENRFSMQSLDGPEHRRQRA